MKINNVFVKTSVFKLVSCRREEADVVAWRGSKHSCWEGFGLSKFLLGSHSWVFELWLTCRTEAVHTTCAGGYTSQNRVQPQKLVF